MPVQHDNAGFRFSSCPLFVHETDCLGTIAKDLQDIQRVVLIQGKAKQQDIAWIVFHKQDSVRTGFRVAQSSSLRFEFNVAG